MAKSIENYKRPVHERLFYVRQGDSYKDELKNQWIVLYPYIYIESQNKYNEKGDNKVIQEIQKGDFILHECDGWVKAISIAKEDCPPKKVYDKKNKPNGEDDKYNMIYRVKTTYHELDVPYNRRAEKDWFKDHRIEGIKYGAFNCNGDAGERYITYIDKEPAIHVLERAIMLQPKEAEALPYLKEALRFIDHKAAAEIEESAVDYSEYEEENHPQAVAISPTTQKEIPKRSRKAVELALKKAEYTCEYDSADKTFKTKTKNEHNYVEGHHLIPINKYRDFPVSLDVAENVVALCPYCHRLLHHGQFEDKKKILDTLYAKHKDGLAKKGIPLSLEKLYKYYY